MQQLFESLQELSNGILVNSEYPKTMSDILLLSTSMHMCNKELVQWSTTVPCGNAVWE